MIQLLSLSCTIAFDDQRKKCDSLQPLSMYCMGYFILPYTQTTSNFITYITFSSQNLLCMHMMKSQSLLCWDQEDVIRLHVNHGLLHDLLIWIFSPLVRVEFKGNILRGRSFRKGHSLDQLKHLIPERVVTPCIISGGL